MSLLRAVHRSAASRSVTSSILNIARKESTSASQTGVQVTERQPSEITTTVPPKDLVAAGVISGAPSVFLSLEYYYLDEIFTLTTAELRHRIVRIFKPTRNTMQSGGAKGERWRIDFDILQGGGRWENPQMGWASSYVPLPVCTRLSLIFSMKCGLHAGHSRIVPFKGRCHPFCGETGCVWLAP